MKKRVKTNDEFDGFTVDVTFDEDGDWLARLVELPTVSAFADILDRAVDELRQAWAGVKESYRKHGQSIPVAPGRKTYDGKLNLRIGKRLRRALAVEATNAGISINDLVVQKLAEAIK